MEAVPSASLVAFAGRELRFAAEGDAHVLRCGAVVLARLEPRADPERAVTGDGRWTLRNRRGSSVDAFGDGSEEPVAAYRPGVTGGGTLRVAGGSAYVLRPPMLGESTRLRRRGTRRTVAKVSGSYEQTVKLEERAREEPDLALIVVVVLAARYFESLMPGAPNGPTTT